MVVGSDDTLTVWLNGKKVYDFADRRGFEHEQARFDVSLSRGPNRILVRCGNRGGGWQFAVAVTAPAEHAFLKAPARETFNPEAYRCACVEGAGECDSRAESLQRLEGPGLHQVPLSRQGGRARWVPSSRAWARSIRRDELIASVLFPSAKISSGYEPSTLALADGRVLTGNRAERDGGLGRNPGRRREDDQGCQGSGRGSEAQRSLC